MLLWRRTRPDSAGALRSRILERDIIKVYNIKTNNNNLLIHNQNVLQKLK